MPQKICVIGAGIIGVTTAVCIQNRIPDAEVTIIAAEFSPNLTSDVAAGHIEPYLLPGEDPERINKWCRETLDYCRKHSRDSSCRGVQEVSGYFFQKEDPIPPIWWNTVSHFRRLSDDEVAEKHPLPQKAGFFFTTFYIESAKHIPWLMEKFCGRGGKVIKRNLKDLNEIGENWDIVVNCSGIGARFLIGDKEVVPIRGQVIRVKAPHVKHFFCDDDFYTLVNDDCIVLGGTAEKGEWDLTFDEEKATKIIEGNTRNVPSLKNAEIISRHVGLRPSRSKIRLEAEDMLIRTKMIPVVHNYGHGGSGVTLCWGAAQEASKIVAEQLIKAKI